METSRRAATAPHACAATTSTQGPPQSNAKYLNHPVGGGRSHAMRGESPVVVLLLPAPVEQQAERQRFIMTNPNQGAASIGQSQKWLQHK